MSSSPSRSVSNQANERPSARESSPERPEISAYSRPPTFMNRWLRSFPLVDTPVRMVFRDIRRVASCSTSRCLYGVVGSERTTVRQRRLHVSTGSATSGGAVKYPLNA